MQYNRIEYKSKFVDLPSSIERQIFIEGIYIKTFETFSPVRCFPTKMCRECLSQSG